MTVLSIASSWLLAFVAVAVVAVISSSLDNVFVSVVRVNAWSTTPPTKQRQQHSSFSSSSLAGVGIGIGRRRRRKSSLYSKDKILLKDTVIVVDSNNNEGEGEDEGSSSSSSSREPLSSTTTTARSSSSSSSSSNTVSEFDRAFELAGITWNEFIYPVGQRLLCDSDSDSDDDIKSNGDWDWDKFWELELLTATTSSQSNTYTNNMTIAEQFTQYLERCGATYVKFGQALSSRPDIVPRSLAIALSKLQDDMDILDNNNNNNNNDFNLDTADGAREILRKEWIASASAVAVDNGDNNTSISTISTTLPLPYFENESEMEKFLNTLSVTPVAAASIGVVYSGILPPSLSSSIVTGVDSKKGKGKTKSKPQKVAIKIQRPNVISTVEKDAKLLKTVAKIIQSIPASKKKNSNGGGGKFIQTNVTGAVDEFMSRLHEELDYYNEADNLELFSKLYSHRRPRPQRQKRRRNKSKQDNNDSDDADDADNNIASSDVFENNNVRVVVPEVYRNLCTDKVLVMEWIDGIKLVDLQRNQRKQQLTSTNTTTSSSSSSDDSHDNNDRGDASNEKINKETLDLISQGIDCTLSQLLDTGILHADPHGGNIFRVRVDDSRRKSKDSDDSNDSYRLGYIDFGMLSTIPTKVQDGLICAVCQLIFAKNVTAVGELFNELMLLPKEVLNDPSEALALGNELEFALSSILVYNTNDANNDGLIIPTLRFDKLLDVLTRLVPRFQFQLPPYFLNNARALATLEGMAREVNPQFNILHNLYPYAISRLFSNPTSSEVVNKCLKSLIENSSTQKLDIHKLQKLLEDASYYSGYKKRKVVNDIMKSKNGFSLVRRLIREQTYDRLLILLSSSRRDEKKRIKNEKRKRKEEQLSLQKQQQLQRSSSSAAAAWIRTTRRRRLRLRLPLLDRVADSFRL
jgi:predicted unusual protein kinase regulating ubiquinone biosynthesis (AarF/ABC1/UbiB family)